MSMKHVEFCEQEVNVILYPNDYWAQSVVTGFLAVFNLFFEKTLSEKVSK
ncbi:hypothetical protein [Bartonella senegalensis]|nr:hypothetical protein [Bartonella senegalensis]